jgi:hypothetical protein
LAAVGEFHFGKKGGIPRGVSERVRKSLRMCEFQTQSFQECGEY